MIFCEARAIGEHVKNSVDHQFIEILGFNVGHREGTSEVFVNGQMVSNFCDRHGGQCHIEMVFEGFSATAGLPSLPPQPKPSAAAVSPTCCPRTAQ